MVCGVAGGVQDQDKLGIQSRVQLANLAHECVSAPPEPDAVTLVIPSREKDRATP